MYDVEGGSLHTDVCQIRRSFLRMPCIPVCMSRIWMGADTRREMLVRTEMRKKITVVFDQVWLKVKCGLK